MTSDKLNFECVARCSNCRSGFSLVEVALALLVAAIGLMSIMALFPVGLDASRRAVDEAQCALFADEIFNGIRAKMSLTNTVWEDIDSIEIGLPAPDMWKNADTIKVRANRSGTNVYEYRYESGMVDFAVRYIMSVGDAPAQGVKYMRLTLWNGERGGTTNPMVFYTEIYDTAR